MTWSSLATNCEARRPPLSTGAEVQPDWPMTVHICRLRHCHPARHPRCPTRTKPPLRGRPVWYSTIWTSACAGPLGRLVRRLPVRSHGMACGPSPGPAEVGHAPVMAHRSPAASRPAGPRRGQADARRHPADACGTRPQPPLHLPPTPHPASWTWTSPSPGGDQTTTGGVVPHDVPAHSGRPRDPATGVHPTHRTHRGRRNGVGVDRGSFPREGLADRPAARSHSADSRRSTKRANAFGTTGDPGVKPYYEADGITIYHGDCRTYWPSWATLPTWSSRTRPYHPAGFGGKRQGGRSIGTHDRHHRSRQSQHAGLPASASLRSSPLQSGRRGADVHRLACGSTPPTPSKRPTWRVLKHARVGQDHDGHGVAVAQPARADRLRQTHPGSDARRQMDGNVLRSNGRAATITHREARGPSARR